MSAWVPLTKDGAGLPHHINLLVVLQCRCCNAQDQNIASFDPERGWRLDSAEEDVLVGDGGNWVITHFKHLDSMPQKVKISK